MSDPRPLHRVLQAIEDWRLQSLNDPEFSPAGPTAKAVDKMLGLVPGHTRQLVQSVNDCGYVLALPPSRGNAQRLKLTEAGRAYLAAGCPRRVHGG
jgi:hypothetical protein